MNRTITGLLGAGGTFALLAATVVLGAGSGGTAEAVGTHAVVPTSPSHSDDANDKKATDNQLIQFKKDKKAPPAKPKPKPHRHHHHHHHHHHKKA